MATNQVLITEGTPIVWARATDYAGAGGTRTHNMDMRNLLNLKARQGVKADLTASRAPEYSVTLGIEYKTGEAPEAGETVDLYWGPSSSVTPGTGNEGGLAGTDAAYTGTDGDGLTNSLKQLKKIGQLILTTDALVPQRKTWVFSPPTRYGQMVVVNSADTEDFNDADANELYVRMVPLIPDIQAAA